MANRRIDFFDGSSSSTSPTIGNISASDLAKYPDDATFEATEAGAPIGGNIYYNTTTDTVRYYRDDLPGWVTLLDDNVVDSNFQISDDVDTTKKMRFEVSSVSSGVTRVYTVPNADTTLVGTDVTQNISNKTVTDNLTVQGGVTTDSITAENTSIVIQTSTVGGETINVITKDFFRIDADQTRLRSNQVQYLDPTDRVAFQFNTDADPLLHSDDSQGTNNARTLEIRSGNQGGANENGANLYFTGGQGDGTGQGGHVIIEAGSTGTGQGGNINLNPGTTTGGVDGQVNVNSDMVVNGDFTVTGTTTTVDTATLDVTDANISVNVGGTQANANTNHAGITVEMSDATDADIGYDSSLASKFHAGEIGSESEIITADHQQRIVNKDIDLGTATDNDGITVSKNTRANLDALTREAGRIYYSTDEQKFLYDDGTQLNEAGGGSGQGGINHLDVDDAQFEVNSIANWNTYLDAGSTDKPFDGTGGSPSVTIALNTTNPLRGTKDLKISKPASDKQGDGVSIDFTTGNADKSTMQEVSFDYGVTANFGYGTALDPANDPSDIVVYVYDVTNSNLIQLSTFNLDGSGRFKGYFQAAADSTSYRLILHVASNNASAWDMFIDNVRVGPVDSLDSSRSVVFRASTTTARSTSTTPPTIIYETAEKDSHGAYNSSTGEYTVAVAGDYIVGGSFRFTNASWTIGFAGIMYIYVNGTVHSMLDSVRADSTSVIFREGGGAALVQNLQVGDVITWKVYSDLSTTLAGSFAESNFIWAQMTRASDATQDDGRLVLARTSGDPGSANAGDPIIFPVVDKDTHGAYNASTGIFTCPIAGDYRVTANLENGNANVDIEVYKNGSFNSFLFNTQAGGQGGASSIIVNCEAGDTLSVRPDLTMNPANFSSASFERLSVTSSVQPSDIIAARANASDSQSIPNATDTTITFENVDFDTHNAYNPSTGVYTAPAPGYYSIDASIRYFHNATAGNYIHIRKNSTVIASGVTVSDAAIGTADWDAKVSTLIYLETGDTVDIQTYQSTGSNKSLTASFANYFNIHRIK